MVQTVIIDWNGTEVPQAFRDLPPGRYLIETLDEPPLLTPDQEAGLLRAMDELDAGRGRAVDQVLARVRVSLDRQ